MCQQVVYVTIENGTTGNLNSFDVPEGKRFVIEHVGGEIFLPAGEFARYSQIRTDFSGAGPRGGESRRGLLARTGMVVSPAAELV